MAKIVEFRMEARLVLSRRWLGTGEVRQPLVAVWVREWPGPRSGRSAPPDEPPLRFFLSA